MGADAGEKGQWCRVVAGQHCGDDNGRSGNPLSSMGRGVKARRGLAATEERILPVPDGSGVVEILA
jgi:hypothetical protein